MPPRISWSNLLPGLVALAAIVLIAVGVVMFAGVGRIRGEKVRLYVLTDQARGVMRGTEVWLAGQKVGQVDGVEFRPPSSDTAARLVIALSLRKRDAEKIRRDADVQLRAGTNFIASPVVHVRGGTPGSLAVREGDTLRARAQSDLEMAGVKLNAATTELGPLMTDVRSVMGHVRDPDGTVGALLTERGGGEMARLRLRVARLRERLFGSNGGRSEASGGVLARTRVALARVDSIRTLLRSSGGSFGRFQRDSTLGATVASVRDELADLRARLENTNGSAGRLTGDRVLARSMADAQHEMALLFDDIRRRPLRYVHF